MFLNNGVETQAAVGLERKFKISLFPGDELISPAECVFAETVVEKNFGELIEVICQNNWSPAIFGNRVDVRSKSSGELLGSGMHKANDNVQAISILSLDIDEGCTIEQAKNYFDGFTFAICTTRHHQKWKNKGKPSEKPPCDRFRVLIPLEREVTNDKDFKATWKSAKERWPFIDDCSDSSRFYFRSSSIVYVADGNPFPVAFASERTNIVAVGVPPRTEPSKGQLSKNTFHFLKHGNPSTGEGNGSWHNLFVKATFDLKQQGYTKQEAIELLEQATKNHLGHLDTEHDLKTIDDIYDNRDVRYPPRLSNHKSPYRLTDRGVYFLYEAQGDDGEFTQEEIFICSYLEVVAYTRDESGKEWGRLLRIRDRDGLEKEWAMPMELLAADGTEFRRMLLNMGVEISPNKKAREKLADYIQTQVPSERVRCVSRIGWHGDHFVLPERSVSLATAQDRVILQLGVESHHSIKTSGTLKEWQENVANLCKGNSRLIFAVAAAFAPPLQHLTDSESGGFHYRGESSTGKSTAIMVAGSVWGGGTDKGFIKKWKATVNGLEAVASSHCDSILLLDELGEVAPKDAGACAYMLANGTGKFRANRNGGLRKNAEWRLIFFSTGEIGLAEHMAQDNQKVRAGQETRMADIPADTGSGMGLFECLHGYSAPEVFAAHLKEVSVRYHGSAIVPFLQEVVKDKETIRLRVLNLKRQFLTRFLPPKASGQVARVAERFALVAAAGELAIEVGILPWNTDDSMSAAATCFKAWIESRGGIGELEVKRALIQVRKFLETFGRTKFQSLHQQERSEEGEFASHDLRAIDQAGFRREKGDTVEWLIFRSAFKEEICKGFDHRLVARALKERGYLITDASGGSTYPERLPGMGKQQRVYKITSAILEDSTE